ncbi:hypothetical protein [Desulfosudis oleivorans]|nr:hypothetical protein [Desulfosudis oleivorans]
MIRPGKDYIWYAVFEIAKGVIEILREVVNRRQNNDSKRDSEEK